jgi:integrase
LVGDLVTQFLKYAERERNSIDFGNYKIVGKILWRYKELTTTEFDAFLLLQIQDGLVQHGYARRYCNKLTNYVIHIFKWGEVRRLVLPGKNGQLKVIEPVRIGAARDNEERMPVDDDVVERTLPYLLPVYQAFIKILRATGARPSEICRMRVSDIDRTDSKVWVYRLRHHKTMRYSKRRILAFGVKEQAILKPYLDKKDQYSAVFSPHDAISELKKIRRDARKTPIPPSQRARDKQREQRPNPRIKEHLNTIAVGKALKAAILKANRQLLPEEQIPRWTLYQLRHSFLTQKTEEFDENVAALLAGHSDPRMVRDIYDKSQERRIIRLKRQEDEQGEEQAAN